MSNVVSERHGEVGIVRLDRPEKLNALSPEMLPEIASAIRGHRGSARGLVLTGTGRAFSAGDDLDATAELDREGIIALAEGFQDLTRAVLDFDGPAVAAINGLIVGGAAEWTLACDARVGQPETFFAFPENGIGLTVTNGSSYLLPRLLGARALPVVLDGRRIEAEEALRLGFLTSIADDAFTEAMQLLERWLTEGTATPWHVRLLRPDREAMEAAMAHEVDTMIEAFEAGIVTAGARSFHR